MAGESDDGRGAGGAGSDRLRGDTGPLELVHDSPPPTPERPAYQPAPAAPVREFPIKDYQNLTIPEIVARVPSLSPNELREVQEYERNHRRRKTLLVRLERHIRSVSE